MCSIPVSPRHLRKDLQADTLLTAVLPLANSAGGHRLGVNGLCVDSPNSVLYSSPYSGGRDGVICAWDLHLDVQNSLSPDYDAKLPAVPATSFRQQVQAHTHWINDITLAKSNQALISASSDITVKLWRPAAHDKTPPQTIGLHSDYVKALAVPSPTSDWVASGGLDRKIHVWDLSGAGQQMSIDVAQDETGSMLSREKGSVYALAATESVIVGGGPESAVKMWDVRSGKRITKLVGHTDNIRDVLVSQDGMTILTASSDRTVKVWSTAAGRCMFTLTMHDASVWSLFSAVPDLSVFYSSDKNGLVVKTDTRNTIELDEGLAVALCQEHEGVHKIAVAGEYLWTATSRPSINRYRDVNTENAEIEVPEGYSIHRSSVVSQRSRYPSVATVREHPTSPGDGALPESKCRIPLKHALRLSNMASFPAPSSVEGDDSTASNRQSLVDGEPASSAVTHPIRTVPEYAIEGQNGIIKHVMLNDRKRVLTLDTAGEVVMWDLLKCIPIRSFGKRHLEDVRDEVTTVATVANWCTVDTRTGSVAVVLEENTCFDGEMYVDELDLDSNNQWREDQRINLGKWVLRYLFADVIAEEALRDQVFRENLLNARTKQRLEREHAPMSIQIPQSSLNGWSQQPSSPTSSSAVKPGPGGISTYTTTPGFNIGLATPGLLPATTASPVTTLGPQGAPSDVSESATKLGQSPVEAKKDYFSHSRNVVDARSPDGTSHNAQTPGESLQEPSTPTLDTATTSGPNSKDPPTPNLFSKKFRMGVSFSGMKKLGRSQTNDANTSGQKPGADDKDNPLDESDSKSLHSKGSHSDNRIVDENFMGTIQKIRHSYEDALTREIQTRVARENGIPVTLAPSTDPNAEPPSSSSPLTMPPSQITPAPPTELPLLFPPANTTILIQEDRPEAGGVADLFETTLASLQHPDTCDQLERFAPMWLGDVLLRNALPQKDVVKISFVLEPYGNELPNIGSAPVVPPAPTTAGSGSIPTSPPPAPTVENSRLNANRMLRAKKVLAYVAERIEPAPPPGEQVLLRPEEYLELWCQGQLIPPTMTLATIRAHIWRGAGDIMLLYRANGKKKIGGVQVRKDLVEP